MQSTVRSAVIYNELSIHFTQPKFRLDGFALGRD
jgi:hypothetical protein